MRFSLKSLLLSVAFAASALGVFKIAYEPLHLRDMAPEPWPLVIFAGLVSGLYGGAVGALLNFAWRGLVVGFVAGVAMLVTGWLLVGWL